MLGDASAVAWARRSRQFRGDAPTRCDLADRTTFDDGNCSWSTLSVSEPGDDRGAPSEPSGDVVVPGGAGATTFGPSGKAIRVAQEQENWCWAASVQMLQNHAGLPARAQCEIASTRLGRPCCPEPAACNVRLHFDRVTNLLAENGLASTRARCQLDGDRFWAEIFHGRPVLLADVFENGTDGHLRVAFGWQQLRRGPLLVRVADPAGKAPRGKSIESIPLEALRRSRWRDTWYRIEVAHGAS